MSKQKQKKSLGTQKQKGSFGRKLKKRISKKFIYYLLSFFLFAYGISPLSMLGYYYDMSSFFLVPYLVYYKPTLYMLGGLFMMFNGKAGTRYLYGLSCLNLLTASVPMTSVIYLFMSNLIHYHPDVFYYVLGFNALVIAEIFIVSFGGYWLYCHLLKKEKKTKKSYLLKRNSDMSIIPFLK